MSGTHEHRWYRLYEDSIIGIGPSLVAWKCVDCAKSVSPSEITPAGLGGVILDERHLVGPHGGLGNCADGSQYARQIYRNGKLEIIR